MGEFSYMIGVGAVAEGAQRSASLAVYEQPYVTEVLL